MPRWQSLRTASSAARPSMLFRFRRGRHVLARRIGLLPDLLAAGAGLLTRDMHRVAGRQRVRRTVHHPVGKRQSLENFDLGAEIAPERDRLAAEPIQYLAVPRFLACMVMTPALTVITDVVGVAGGAVVAFFSLGITPDMYIENILGTISLADFLSGFSKSFFFGAEIAIISCLSGFRTSGGAEGVGKATIQAVVRSSMVILISDYFLTYMLQMVNL